MSQSIEALAKEAAHLRQLEADADDALLANRPRCRANGESARLTATMHRLALRRQALLDLMAFVPPQSTREAVITTVVAVALQDRARVAITDRDIVEVGFDNIRLEAALLGLLHYLENAVGVSVDDLNLEFLVPVGWRTIPRA